LDEILYHRCGLSQSLQKKGTGNREQGTGNREQGTGNREQIRNKSCTSLKLSQKKDVFKRCVARKKQHFDTAQ